MPGSKRLSPGKYLPRCNVKVDDGKNVPVQIEEYCRGSVSETQYNDVISSPVHRERCGAYHKSTGPNPMTSSLSLQKHCTEDEEGSRSVRIESLRGVEGGDPGVFRYVHVGIAEMSQRRTKCAKREDCSRCSSVFARDYQRWMRFERSLARLKMRSSKDLEEIGIAPRRGNDRR